MNKNLPIYDLDINEAENKIVDMISLVASPATGANWFAFSEQVETKKLAFSEDKKQLYGIAMIPDLPIYRKVGNQELYVKATKEKIEKIVHTFMRKGLTTKLNVDHKAIDANSYVFQNIIVDNEKGFKAPAQLGDVVDGSWVIAVQVCDDQLWQDIKDGKKNGFSVEGLFELFETNYQVVDNPHNEVADVVISIETVEEDTTDEELNEIFSLVENYYKYLYNSNNG
ncbi:XkdF-like putative serine protease domain-containing protein [Sphingobacterium sp. 1.A.5]|uniref:XkdF-like putative serine protease domain-containing protein n=1 Tax=Sphingobacterium sp. 1.A.5 TaxID=2044604 RepID=UPI000C0BBFC1|nr:XkdF-like putative serine protease domain-containing protein [Sphingobacterium sp. 1.A.5]